MSRGSLTLCCCFQNSIIPGPPFLFGACSVLLALLVALFIPEHTNLNVRSSNWKKHCGSHGHPHSPQAPGEAKEPLLQDTNVWQKSRSTVWTLLSSAVWDTHSNSIEMSFLKVILRSIFLHEICRNWNRNFLQRCCHWTKNLLAFINKLLHTCLLPWNAVTAKLYILVQRQTIESRHEHVSFCFLTVVSFNSSHATSQWDRLASM